MTLIRAQVILKTADNFPENFITNTLHFDSQDLALDPPRLTTVIKAFYDSLRTYLSPAIAGSGHMVKWYAVDQPAPNYPYLETTWNIQQPLGSSGLPSEVALVTSFEAIRQNGSPQASRRGRIYIGPLSTTANTAGRPSPAFVTALAKATQLLVLDSADSTGPMAATRLVVYSTKYGNSAEVFDGWVDNAFDTQRRRGVDPSSRLSWDVTVLIP